MQIKDDITIYYPYVIPEEVKRPDILSYQIYGDVKFTWTIFLLIKYLIRIAMPMDTRTFENYLIGKYGSVEESKLKVEYYEKIWRELRQELQIQSQNRQLGLTTLLILKQILILEE